MLDQTALDAERRRLFAANRAGLPMPVAGLVVFTALAIASVFVDYASWMLLCAYALGAIFPIAMALQAPLKAPFFKTKSPLNGVLLPAVIAANLHWPVTVALMLEAPALFPLALGMSTIGIWAVVGWMYASPVGLMHTLIRVGGVTALFLLLPDTENQATAISAFVALVYAISIAGFVIELNARTKTGSAPA
ncbi:hypothetical protein GCM10011367_27030 [Marinicauda pacifica]|jgi:hypothetical protein|uniref:Uncharacterized protein n=1 Tax=Marinicauda pacifica TaxID=1133559 RepID=A0A4S2H7R4_9PROT|nr:MULTISPECIES: hypothetical protein [Marinicauda]TGY91703.1 hypothetical protein E5162_13855 [Marinicauda pacifica]GGE50715.1 hypothetical protein GCM10011367_27030 [Marinicauda pacifica]